MDAVKFIEERNRMCSSYDTGCLGCQAFLTLGYCGLGVGSKIDAASQVAMVEKWSSEHPPKTRQDAFLEQWPETAVADDGILTLCPATISSTHRNQDGGCGMRATSCSDCCRDFWMQEVE